MNTCLIFAQNLRTIKNKPSLSKGQVPHN